MTKTQDGWVIFILIMIWLSVCTRPSEAHWTIYPHKHREERQKVIKYCWDKAGRESEMEYRDCLYPEHQLNYAYGEHLFFRTFKEKRNHCKERARRFEFSQLEACLEFYGIRTYL